MRTVVWFSCGAASFSCLWLMRDKDIVPVYCDTGGEHNDNMRFLAETEDIVGKKITILKSDKYKDHLDVCQKTRYINGAGGARCTVELKKRLRFQFQEPTDIQIFGYTADEKHRAERLDSAYPEANGKYPLIENGWNKQDCINLLLRLKINIPKMYQLGYKNNNCIGCVKGGAGYWNKIRQDFPEVFEKMAHIEREVGHSCIRGTFLDELEPSKGYSPKEYEMECDFICQAMDLNAQVADAESIGFNS